MITAVQRPAFGHRYGSGGRHVDTYPVRLKQARRLYAESLKAHFDKLIAKVLATPPEKRVYYV